jgi:AraC-like DNA-binding protein
MKYDRVTPSPDLRHIIQCFWTVEDDDPTPRQQKIIPDGYPELIFHFDAPYRIHLRNRWEMQANGLLAGQIRKHFFLQNTGRSSILGVKLQPSAITHLFGIGMDTLTDRVVGVMSQAGADELARLQIEVEAAGSDSRISIVEEFFRQRKTRIPDKHLIDISLEAIFTDHGMISVQEIALKTGFSERHIEQQFKRFVGLSPKFFARIVRFSYVFNVISDNRPDWNDVVYQAGFYDQSHFIRNFKAFTGEDPSKYMFGRKDLANFFLKQH